MSFPLMLMAGAFIFITVVAFAFTVRGLFGIKFSTVRLLFSGALEDGRLNVNVRTLADARDRSNIGGMLLDGLLTILACAAGLMAVILLGQNGGPQVNEQVSTFQFIGYALLSMP